MKNLIFIIFTIILFNINTDVYALKNEVLFSDCVDGDTAKFILDNEEITVRFLAIDTPETKHPTKEVEIFGKDASEFTCNSLKNARKIELEYDENSDLKDKYERYLAWIWIDNKLLQNEIISEGLASVAYIYDDYKYVDLLESTQDEAKSNKKGIWSESSNDDILNNENIHLIIIGFIVIILSLIFNKNYRKKATKKIIKEIESLL